MNGLALRKLDKLLHPDSVAIIGASPDKKKVGYAALRNMVYSGFKGKIYAINPKAEQYGEIEGVKVYKSINDVPDSIDLAVVCIPARFITSLMEDMGKKGVKYAAIITAGFKETGPEGKKLEIEIVKIAKKYGIRIVGPNILGVIDTSAPMNASFAERSPIKGNIAFLSQSGALLAGILDWSRAEGIGYSSFVSLGNKADLDETDFIEALSEDQHTLAILVYLESINRGRDFIKVCREVTRKKPVIIIKSGRSEAGSRAASSHTGSMTGADTTYDVAFEKCGVIRADNSQELFDMAFAFSFMPIPKGNKIVILTNAGGPGILATDEAERNGLELAIISPEFKSHLKEFLPPAANFNNPIDALGTAQGEDYGRVLELALNDEGVDGAIVILTPQAMTEGQETADEIVRVHMKYPDKPIVSIFIGGEILGPSIYYLKKNRIPCYPHPERGVKAMAALVEYARIKNRPVDNEIPDLKRNRNKVKQIFDKVKSENRVNLLGTEAIDVAKAYGIQTPTTMLAKSDEEAGIFSEKIGFPVVMKITSPDIVHKTDIGGVKLNIHTKDEAIQTYKEIIANAQKHHPKTKLLAVDIQNMEPVGRELIVGSMNDPQFGSLVMVGLGGIYTNFFKDVSFGLAPLTVLEAEKMLKRTKTYALLKGVRGEKPSDISAVIDTLLRISLLVNDFPIIKELDINPFFVYEKGKGVSALDVKITLDQ
ncbi:MAG: acetate--CoA ligase family protein [Candidatus Heimdallarchaeota archaeon]|nr:acetate--CoA ligase family protein [Candidatus Heimdallarchaeota archaeon]MCK4953985.1 acetate--CoA ligase family protein [Candidatus Heimdallarchaeota archaeon]